MTKEQEYFLKLVKSHLNNEIPEAPNDIDYSELFKVCEIQNMTAIAAIELKKLPVDSRLSKEDFSPFNQVLGLTLQNYEFKLKGINILSDTLNKSGIKHVFVKGAAIRRLYPVPEVRTSGDTDVIVDCDKLDNAAELLINEGFTKIRNSGEEYDLTYYGEEYEVKSHLEYYNEKCKDIFSDIFSEKISSSTNDNEFTIKPLYHLVYITYHILKHFKSGGAGIRQLTDIDILLRNENINFEEYMEICCEIGIEKSASVLVSLSKKYFDTPVDFEYDIDEKLFEMLESVMLDGGTFGYGIGNTGTARLMNTINKSSKFSSVRSVIGLFIIDRASLYSYYEYARKKHILLPVAYLNRIYDAVFKRGKRNINNIKSMFSDKEVASLMSDMLKELEID